MSQPYSPDQVRIQELGEARELRIYLRTVGDMVRLQILRLLAGHAEMSVTELVGALHTSQPLLSWHLGVLKRSQLVCIRREGRVAWYSLNRPVFRAFHARLDAWIGDRSESLDKVEREDDV